jgi:glyceraldehyde-3-phosphate dehydrogenase (NAD(P))
MIEQIAKVESMVKRGAKLVVDDNMVDGFVKLGHTPQYTFDEAYAKANVVIDCTPVGNKHKEKHYLKTKNKTFIAQGSEKGFGIPYAYGINDAALVKQKNQFIQVVSCNTHNICSLIKTLSPDFDRIVNADFVCIRRANDISQDGNFIASPQVGEHNDTNYGTHHARDASRVLETLYQHKSLYSSAMKINSQYMHCIRFNITLLGSVSTSDALNMFRENKFTALTHKTSTNKVFSFGRDHGYYGRIYNQTVVSIPSISATQLSGNTRVTGFCFTPQDGNSLLSSVAAAMYAIYGKEYLSHMSHFDQMLFSEI